MRTSYILQLVALGAVALAGCGDDKAPAMTSTATKTSADEDSNSDTGGATETPTTGSAPQTTGIVEPETSESSNGTAGTAVDPSASSGSSGCMFICNDTETGTGPMNECDIWKEDCPEGQKCMPWAADGGSSWNATKCSPVQGNPGQVGDECSVEGSGVSGIDSCDKHLLCWYTDAMNVGSCINMCEGSEDAPSCPGGQTCDVSNDGVLILCLETCDPLAQSCPEGQICFWDGVDTFICDFDASGDEGQYGDPCAFINVCDYGLFCAAPETVPGCDSADGCCSTYCNLMEPNTCPGAPQQECVAWYAEGSAPPGQENIGACAVPM